MWRKVLMVTAAQAALGLPAAVAQTMTDTESDRGVTPYSVHDIEPFAGDILAFNGDILAFGGDILAFGGDILAFNIDINPFHGRLTTSYGDISPFWGDTRSFWHDIQPFGEDGALFWGDIQPFGAGGDPVVGGVGAFWAEIGPMWGDVFGFWSDAATGRAGDWNDVRTHLIDIIAFSESAWGGVVAEKTGMDFTDFANGIAGEFGFDIHDASTFAGVDATALSAFFLEYHDRLMALTGTDHIDHWMPMVNWTPVLTQDQGDGADSRIGLLDSRIKPTEDSIAYLVHVGGYATDSLGHGAAVASLMAARHDGRGVMGIAPMSTVFAYNPFDASGTASRDDVAAGIRALANHGVSVINMSLGVPGATLDQAIADVLTDGSMGRYRDDLIVVAAAGNDGITQAEDIEWAGRGLRVKNLLIVGSVTPTGTMSGFSNRPGDACLVTARGCEAGHRVMDRFLVAPGELLLVSDNEGGTMRVSGTSFAAPLVTGAISLLHTRWPWLERHTEETTDIILRTARDLGDPGVDAVYGHGLLDVEASQAPLDFDRLVMFLDDDGDGRFRHASGSMIRDAAIDMGTLNLWEAQGAQLYAYEFIGGTFRDFVIPLSTRLHGQDSGFWTGAAMYQRHVQNRLMDWANGSTAGFDTTQTVAATDQWSLTVTSHGGIGTNGALTFRSDELGLTAVVGMGEGLRSLSSTGAFSALEDYDPERGGAGPLLGLAAGGTFGALAFDLPKAFTLTLGYAGTAIDQSEIDPLTGIEVEENQAFGRRDALAAQAELAFRPTERLVVAAAVTGLNEEEGILGALGTGPLAIGSDSVTAGVSMTARYDLHPRLAFAATATGARSLSDDDGAVGLHVGSEGMLTTAFQVNAELRKLFTRRDLLTLSAAQPLHVEAGGLDFTSLQVTDRATGALGLATDRWDLSRADRHFAFEADYSVSLADGNVHLGAYSRYDINDVDITGRFNALSVGARLGITY